MKKTNSLLKIGLVGLFLTLSSAILAQTGPPAPPDPTSPITEAADLNIGRINDNETDVVTDPAAVFFYNPTNEGTSVELVASETDDSTPAITFDYYAWYVVDEAGTETGGSLGSARTLALSGANLLQPGFHRFRVYGFVGVEAGVNCESEQFQDIILFVLRPLAPTATNTDAITEFCIGDSGTFRLEAEVDFALAYENTSFPNPDVEEFDLTYTWYAVRDGGTPIALTAATSTNAGATATATIDYALLDEAGTYTFYVEVEYSSAIKDKGAREEGHGFWRTTVSDNLTSNDYKIVVTPRPGRPTISFGTIVD